MKCYVLEMDNRCCRENQITSLIKKNKGIKKDARCEIKWADYEACLAGYYDKTSDVYRIAASSDLKLTVRKEKKKTFAPLLDKSIMLNCGLHFVPLGHYKCRNMTLQTPCFMCEQDELDSKHYLMSTNK